MDTLFEMTGEPTCICVPFAVVSVEPWCPVHDPTGNIIVPEHERVRDDHGRPLRPGA